MDPPVDLDRRITGIAVLDQPLRRELYRLLSERDGWLSRDEAADALGVARSVAAFHLDKLAEAGIVEVHFERVSGRSGPGAGRPAKLFRRRHDELSASVPDRHYELAGSLLAAGVADAIRTGRPVADCLGAAAQAAGCRIGERARRERGAAAIDEDGVEVVSDVLAHHGYEPRIEDGDDERGEVALANCPFHRLAEQERNLVCGMNLDFVKGIIDGVGHTDRLTAKLAPERGFCCVRISAPAQVVRTT